jgi:hypothetical protein
MGIRCEEDGHHETRGPPRLMLARLLDRLGGVLRPAHAADVKLLPFEGIVVHPELRQVLKKLLPKLLDVLDLLVFMRAGRYGE